MPLHILLGEKEYLDGRDISPDEIYAWADANEDTPKTSAVGFEEAGDIMKQIVVTDDEMIIFTISGKMSTTANIFRMSADDLGLEDRISVIDSENLSTGVGMLVIEAAEMSLDGKSREEICQRIEELKKKAQVSFVVDTLTYLHRGGRCSSIAALAGGVLKLHPKIVVSEGSMKADKKYRGKAENAILDYAKELEDLLKEADEKRVFITHSGCKKELIDEVYAYLKELNYFNEIYVARAGGVISSHCGPGTLGILYLAK